MKMHQENDTIKFKKELTDTVKKDCVFFEHD